VMYCYFDRKQDITISEYPFIWKDQEARQLWELDDNGDYLLCLVYL